MLSVLQSMWSAIKVITFSFIQLFEAVLVIGGLILISIVAGIVSLFRKHSRV